MLAELKKRLFFWKRNNPRLENLPAEQLRHIITESDHISAAVDSTQGRLTPEGMERLKALTRTLVRAVVDRAGQRLLQSVRVVERLPATVFRQQQLVKHESRTLELANCIPISASQARRVG